MKYLTVKDLAPLDGEDHRVHPAFDQHGQPCALIQASVSSFGDDPDAPVGILLRLNSHAVLSLRAMPTMLASFNFQSANYDYGNISTDDQFIEENADGSGDGTPGPLECVQHDGYGTITEASIVVWRKREGSPGGFLAFESRGGADDDTTQLWGELPSIESIEAALKAATIAKVELDKLAASPEWVEVEKVRVSRRLRATVEDPFANVIVLEFDPRDMTQGGPGGALAFNFAPIRKAIAEGTMMEPTE